MEPGSGDTRPEADRSFNRWLLEWMLAWTADPSVLRVDSEPNEDGSDGYLVVEIDRSAPDQSAINTPCCDLADRHHRLIRELDRRVETLAVRCESPLTGPDCTDIDCTHVDCTDVDCTHVDCADVDCIDVDRTDVERNDPVEVYG